MLILILYIFGFIVLSGIMAMIDAAVLSVSPAEVETMAAKNRPGAGALQKLYKHITRAVVVIVAFTNTVNVFGPIIVGQKAVDIYGDVVIGVITAVLTFGTIIFSEIIPKSLGVHYAPKISRIAAPFVWFFTYALFPVVVFLEWVSKLMQRGHRHIGTEDQVRALVKLGGSAGLIEKDEIQLIHRVFTLNDRTAGQIMTALQEVTGLGAGLTIAEAAKLAKEKRFSRFPVFATSGDDVSGVVLARDILEAALEGKGDEPVGRFTHPVPEVGYEDKSDDLLPMFRDMKLHMAVVKRDGRTAGVVTLEDVLEELVGEIWDETDS
jgi:CBS domain containing-hemolysin-like protein